jgi:hypothetical protein
MLLRIRALMLVVVASLVLTTVSVTLSEAAKIHKGTSSQVSKHAKITAAQANTAALKKYPGTVVGKTKLENEEGVWQYGVMVESGKTLREVMVNAKTGKIDTVEVTSASKERVEARSEAKMKVKSTKTPMKKPVARSK